MNTISNEQKTAVLKCLVEGCSIRSTVRLTGVSKDTILRLLADAGEVALEYQDRMLRNLTCQRLQCDEIWCFCYAKQKNVPDEMKGLPGVGDMWTWTAMDAQTKLMVSWQLGARDAANAHVFMSDVAERLANRVQLTTDGNRTYLDAVENNFGSNIDFAQLIKLYGKSDNNPDTKYSPAKCLGAKKKAVMGNPDQDHVSTSYAERQNLNIRMKNRRFTRLTNAFSKKAINLAYSIAIDFFHHNFCRIHQTLRMTPAMKAGISQYPMTIEDLVEMLPLPVAKKRGTYRPRRKKIAEI
jgi:IS1 family transposase